MIQKYMSSPFPRKRNWKHYLCPLMGGLLISSLSLTTQAATIFVSKNGNDANSGLEAIKPLATVNKGVSVAVTNGGGTLRVAIGKYNEAPITLPAGVAISGGWDNTFADGKRNIFDNTKKIPTQFEEKLCENHTCLTTTQGPHVVSTMGSNPGNQKPDVLPARSLSQLIIIGPDCAAPQSNATCDSSFGVIVDQPNVHLDYLLIKAGTGNTGIKGPDGKIGTGTCSYGGAGGKVIGTSTIWTFSCQGGIGNAGENVTLNDVVVALGGAGGEPGESSCTAWPYARSDNPETGKVGKNGSPGATGKAGTPAPIIDLGFTPSTNHLRLDLNHNTSGQGSKGSPGSGGGGGGAGGSWNYFFGGCIGGYPVTGGRGHDGNRGGCSGEGGVGGSSGAGAFALVINNTKVMSESIVLLGGQGGMGGVGGNGALGSPGAKDDSLGKLGSKAGPRAKGDCGFLNWQLPDRNGGYGGPGGHGGDGGDGGGGGGGNGGPAITLVKMNKNAALEVKSGGTYHVKGGRAGIGGSGGKNGACIKDPKICVTAGSGTGGNPIVIDPTVSASVSSEVHAHSLSGPSNIINGLDGISQESIQLP